jgi:hypothetical protein
MSGYTDGPLLLTTFSVLLLCLGFTVYKLRSLDNAVKNLSQNMEGFVSAVKLTSDNGYSLTMSYSIPKDFLFTQVVVSDAFPWSSACGSAASSKLVDITVNVGSQPNLSDISTNSGRFFNPLGCGNSSIASVSGVVEIRKIYVNITGIAAGSSPLPDVIPLTINVTYAPP